MTFFITIFISFKMVFLTNPTPQNTFKLEDYYKVENTYSGEVDTGETFHLIVAKNKETKAFDIIPLTYNDNNFNRLESISFNELPSILSHHTNKNIVTLVTSSNKDNNLLTVLDVNLTTGSTNIGEPINVENFKTVVKSKHESILLFADKEEFQILKIKDSKGNTTTKIPATTQTSDFLKDLSKNTIENVVTSEHVANGSINEIKAYLENNTLFLTQNDTKNQSTNVFSLNMKEEGETNFKVNRFSNPEDYKKTASFLKQGNLVRFSLDKKSGEIILNNLESGDSKTINISKDVITSSSKYFYSLDEFLKEASKSSNEPTITANQTDNGNIVLRGDYVSSKNYQYYNWFWIHQHMIHQQMIWQQQIQMRNHQMRSFGPFLDSDYYPSNQEFRAERSYFEIAIDLDFNVLSNHEEASFKEINKAKLMDNFRHRNKWDFYSTIYSENEFRVFGYDKRNKVFTVKTKTYK